MIELLRAQFSTQLDHRYGTRLFDTLNWFDMLAKHCFADAQLHIAHSVLDNGGAHNSAWMPLIDDGKMLSALANWYSFSYAPLFVGANDDAVRLSLIAELARNLRGVRAHISLYPVVDDIGSATMIVRAFRRAGWISMATPMGSNHILHLNGRDFATYWASRPGSLRSGVKRKGSGKPFVFTIERELTDSLWDEYLRVYDVSWKQPEPYPALLRAVAQDAAARGALRLGIARQADGSAIAAQIWTIEGDTALIHKLAHDRALDKQSPGTLLSHHMFAHVIDGDHVALIDYGTGDNDHKRQWMEEERPMMRIDCFDPARPAIWFKAARIAISGLVGRRKGR